MDAVVVLVTVGLLGLAALVGAGWFGQMQAEPIRDGYQPPLSPERVTADDLVDIRFATGPLGYDMAQVDELMARIARELSVREECTPRDAASSPANGEPDRADTATDADR